VGKTFVTEVIRLPESRPPAHWLEGNSLWLDGHPLGSGALLPPTNPVLLPLTLHSIWPGFILLTIDSWVHEAANVLTPGNIPGVVKGPQFFKPEANLRGCHGNTGLGGEWLRKQKEVFFTQKRTVSG